MIFWQTYAGTYLESLGVRFTAGPFALLITRFVEENKISHDEIKQIRAILHRQVRKGG